MSDITYVPESIGIECETVPVHDSYGFPLQLGYVVNLTFKVHADSMDVVRNWLGYYLNLKHSPTIIPSPVESGCRPIFTIHLYDVSQDDAFKLETWYLASTKQSTETMQ